MIDLKIKVDISTNSFYIQFTKVFNPPYDEEKIKKIAESGGCILYIWPETTYHYLSKFIKYGGKKVIVIGIFDVPDHFWIMEHPDSNPSDAPLICPKFPPKNSQKCQWQLVKTIIPPHYSDFDETTHDNIQFFERK